MARLLSQTLKLRQAQPFLTQARRFRSTISRKGRLIEVELPSSSPSSSSDGAELEAMMLKKLDDVVHRLIVQKSTPDWLPFLPGYSFWVPPRQGRMKFADLVGKLADQLSDEEALSLSSDRGWPSASFFVDRNGIRQTREVGVEADDSKEIESDVEEEVPTDSWDSQPFEDKEG